MKVAIVIKEVKDDSLGDCLSSAHSFCIYDTKTALIRMIKAPEKVRQMAKVNAAFLKSYEVAMVAALDFGPRAISALEEVGIQVYKAEKDLNIESQFKTMIKNIKK